jgi:hypothetical protein
MPQLGYAATGATGQSAMGVTGIVSVSYTEEVEAIDITHRGSSVSGVADAFRVATGGFVTKTVEIECLDATTVMTKLAEAGSGYAVTSVTENQPLDGPVTFTVTAREV